MGDPVSDFSWQKLITGGIKDGLKSGLTSIGLSATKWAVGWVLTTAFGYQSPKTKNKEALKTALTDIQNELANIDQVLNFISQQLATLQSTITTDFQQQLVQMEEAQVNAQIKNIEAAWKALATLLTDIMSGTSAQTASGDPTLTFANDVVQTWNIPSDLLGMSSAMIGGTESDNIGLLDAWTNVMISGINAGTATPKQAYGFLEQNFLTLLQWLYRGYTLCAASEMRISLNNALLQGGLTEQQIEQKVQSAGLNYIAINATPDLAEVAQLFVQCAHRLMLSQYMRPVNTTGSPSSGPNTFATMTSQSDATYSLARANLIQWMINLQDTDPTNPGLIVNTYLRPSMLVAGAPPSLTPNGSYAPSTGKLFKLNAQYLNAWFRVVDYADAGFTQILDYSASTIPIGVYSWQTPVPVTGKPVGSSGPFATITPAYYDTLTLDSQSTATDTTVIYGFGFDMSAITINQVFNSYNWPSTSMQYPWSFSFDQPPSSTKDIQYATMKCGTPPLFLGRLSMWGNLNITGQYKGPQITWTMSTTRVLTYVGSDNATLIVGVNAAAPMNGANGNALGGGIYAAVPWNTAVLIAIGSQQVLSQSLSDPGLGKGGKSNTNSANPSVQTLVSVNVTGGSKQNLAPVFQITLTAEHQSSAKDYNNKNGTGYIQTDLNVYAFTPAWPQPTPLAN